MRRALRRIAVGAQVRAQARARTFVPPTRGWIANENIAQANPAGARVLENWFPTQTGARVRGGSSLHATIGSDPVEAMFAYVAGATKRFFAADETDVYNITAPASPLQTFGLAYDAQTANFTIGQVVTGGTSGATATITDDTDAGATGTLSVQSVSGTFQDDETITDPLGGSATSNIPSGLTLLDPVADITGQTSGDYSSAPFETAGGNFLYIVNGADFAQLYDGTSWSQITDEATFGLAYDAQTANFTVGQVVTGGTSGATATITADDDQGGTGTLSVQGITGTFQDNETITDPLGGSATSNIPGGVTTIQGVAITGVATSSLSHVWVYRNRLYFVQGGSNSVWYLPVDALGGAATEFSLRGVFQRGGSLLFGATWSLDAGDGADDTAVFVSDSGEMAVYEGAFPGDASWRLIGRYDISQPLGKNATMQAGGDLLIATSDGIVPVSEAINKDPAALSLAAVTRAIEPEWRAFVALRKSVPWQMLKWPEFNMGLVALPVIDNSTPAECVVVNLETGAWAKYTGWDTRSLVLHDNHAYFGTSDGRVFKAEDGGSDNGASYVSTYVGLFDPLAEFGAMKIARMARATFLAARAFRPRLSVSVNYAVSLPAAPDAVVSTGDDLWDVGLWDLARWSGAGDKMASLKWAGVNGVGITLAPQIQITNNQTGTPDAELASFDLLYEVGGVVV